MSYLKVHILTHKLCAHRNDWPSILIIRTSSFDFQVMFFIIKTIMLQAAEVVVFQMIKISDER